MGPSYHFDVCMYICANVPVYLCIYVSRLEAATMGGGLLPATPPGDFRGAASLELPAGEIKGFRAETKGFRAQKRNKP